MLSPSIPDSHMVRTYPKYYATSDTDSEVEAQFEVESGDQEQLSIVHRLQQNRDFIDHQLAAPSACILESQAWKTTEGSEVILIRKPTASYMSHRILNPHIYRNIRNVGTLDGLALLLETHDDWEKRYSLVMEDGRIGRRFNIFSF